MNKFFAFIQNAWVYGDGAVLWFEYGGPHWRDVRRRKLLRYRWPCPLGPHVDSVYERIHFGDCSCCHWEEYVSVWKLIYWRAALRLIDLKWSARYWVWVSKEWLKKWRA